MIQAPTCDECGHLMVRLLPGSALDCLHCGPTVDPKARAYREAHAAVRSCLLILALHDYEALIADIDRAGAVGPILDPTLWRAKHKAMDEDKELFALAAPLAKLGRLLSEAASRSDP